MKLINKFKGILIGQNHHGEVMDKVDIYHNGWT